MVSVHGGSPVPLRRQIGELVLLLSSPSTSAPSVWEEFRPPLTNGGLLHSKGLNSSFNIFVQALQIHFEAFIVCPTALYILLRLLI